MFDIDNHYKDLEVRIHSTLTENYTAPIKLWYLCRALSNSGKATFNIDKVCNTFSVTHHTVRNWMREGIKLNIFKRILKVAKGEFKVYYTSLIKLCVAKKLDTFGAVGNATLNEVKTIKVSSAEITAQSVQASSRYLAKKENLNIHSSQRVTLPEELFDTEGNPSSELCVGALGYNSDHNTLFVNQSFKPYGASQFTIGNKLGRHIKTIERRLKKTSKIRIARFDRINSIELQIAQQDWSCDIGRYLKVNSLQICPNENALGKTFKLLTNIYYPAYLLTSMKCRRRELNIETINYI